MPRPSKEHVESAHAPVTGPGAGEGQHEARERPARQPHGYALLQDGFLVFRIQATTVDDEHTAISALMGLGQELLEVGARLLAGEAVQIEVTLIREFTRTKPAHHARIEADNAALDVLAGVGDIEGAGP